MNSYVKPGGLVAGLDTIFNENKSPRARLDVTMYEDAQTQQRIITAFVKELAECDNDLVADALQNGETPEIQDLDKRTITQQLEEARVRRQAELAKFGESKGEISAIIILTPERWNSLNQYWRNRVSELDLVCYAIGPVDPAP